MRAFLDVTETPLPPESALWPRISDGDFLDCYVVWAEATPRAAAEVITTFPGWARVLVMVRRVVTAPFGLSNDGPDLPNKVGAFPVEIETDTEVVAGFDDKHLNFRVSVIAKEGRVSLATWVHPHNLAGRLYLKAIMPFHILIARDALCRVAAA